MPIASIIKVILNRFFLLVSLDIVIPSLFDNIRPMYICDYTFTLKQLRVRANSFKIEIFIICEVNQKNVWFNVTFSMFYIISS
jgi:hypothetical protein